MKIISQLILLAFTVVTLTACDDMGKGPSKPASASSSEASSK